MRVKGDSAGWAPDVDINVLDIEVENLLGSVSASSDPDIKLNRSLPA